MSQAAPDDAKDRRQAERAQRVAALLETEVWRLDVHPILEHLYQGYLAKVVGGETHAIWALRALEDVVHTLDASLSLGSAATKRLALRRFSVDSAA